jgi:[ribosomal protein S5]-alanine N-acetyltransferase
MIKSILNQKQFSTNRLLLTPLSTEDNTFIFELLNTEGWKKWIGERNIHTLEDASNYILKIQNMSEAIYWTVRKIENNTPIGVITILKRTNFEFPDLGFAFLAEFSGKGFAFEASNEIIKAIKKHTQLETLIGITLKNNINSIQLLERLNMVLEKEFTEEKEQLLLYKLDLKNSNI